MPTTPPTTPPAIAPTLVCDGFGVGDDASDGEAVAENDGDGKVGVEDVGLGAVVGVPVVKAVKADEQTAVAGGNLSAPAVIATKSNPN